MPEIRTEISINAPAEKVWEILTDFNQYPHWNPFIISIRGAARVDEFVTFKASVNQRMFKFKARILKSEPNRYLSWGGPDNPLAALLVAGNHYFEIQTISPTQCKFIHGEKFTGVIPNAFWFYIRKAKSAYVAMNHALKERVEVHQ